MKKIGEIEKVEESQAGKIYRLDLDLEDKPRTVLYPADYDEKRIANSICSDLCKFGKIDREEKEVVVEDGSVHLRELLEDDEETEDEEEQ